MAEPRRIIPISAPTADQKEKTKKGEPTIRFSLTLTESTERTCPEFSYGELVKNALGEKVEIKNTTILNSANPFNDADEEDLQSLQAIAKRFEQKYGPKPGKKRKRDRIEDLIDATWGYDETDPFVDDTQAYDELVPAELTTQFGGFYINSGGLEFRPISSSDDSDNDFQDPNKKKKSLKKKRKSIDGVEKEKKKKSKDSSSPFKKPRKQSLKNGTKSKKSTPTVAELLQRQSKPTSSVRKPVISDDEKDDDDMSKNILDSINAVVQEAFAVANTSEPNTTGGSDSDGNTNSEVSDAVPKLPNNLPSDLEGNIDKMKAAASSADGKCKFFTADINKTLLQIERQSRELSCGARSSIYGYLGSHLPCSKETLLKRAKKLRLNEQDSRLKEPLQKLREAVGRVMPLQLDRYQEECQQAAQNKYDRMMDDKIKDGEKMTSDDEEDEKSKRNQAPRKKFQWTEEIRKLLCDVVAIKVKTYEMSKTRSQSAEDYLKQFLDAEIKQLWPQGWMQTRMLFKESRSVHGHLTLAPNKQKKFMSIVTKKPTNKKPSNETTGDNSNISAAETNTPTLLDYADKTPSTCTTEDSQGSDELFQIKREREKERNQLSTNQSASSAISMIIKSELVRKEKSAASVSTSPSSSSVTAALKKELLKREKAAAAAATTSTTANAVTNSAATSNASNATPAMPNASYVPSLDMWKNASMNESLRLTNASPKSMTLDKSMSPFVRVSPIPNTTLQSTTTPSVYTSKTSATTPTAYTSKSSATTPIVYSSKPSATTSPAYTNKSSAATSSAYTSKSSATTSPAYTSKLSATTSPAYTSKSIATTSPAYTNKSSATTSPAYTSKASATTLTMYSSKPSATTSPAYTSKSSATLSPAYTNKSSATTSPAYTSKVSATTSIVYSSKPSATSPAYTSKSSATSPAYTSKSSVTTSPAYTSKASATTPIVYSSKPSTTTSPAYTSKPSATTSPVYTNKTSASVYEAKDLSMNVRKVASASSLDGKIQTTTTAVQNKSIQEPIVQKLKQMTSPMNIPAMGASTSSLSLKKSPSAVGVQAPSASPLSLKKSPSSVPVGTQSTGNDQSNVKIHVPSTLTLPSSSGNRTVFTTTSTRLVATSSTAIASTNHSNVITTNHSQSGARMSVKKEESMSTTAAASLLLASFGHNVSRAALSKKDTDVIPASLRTMPPSQDISRNVYKTGKSNSSSKAAGYPTYVTKGVTKNTNVTTAMYSGSPMNTATTVYSSNPKKSTVTGSMSQMSGLLSSQLSPQLPASSTGYGDSLISRNVSPRLLQTSSVVSQGPVAATTTTSPQALHTVANSSGLLGGASNVAATAGNMAGYQSITLVDLTRDSPLPKQHPLSRDAIITGPAPGTYIHGQGALYTSMHSSPPHHQLPPPSLQSFQHQSYTDSSYNREGTPKLPRKYQQ
ncbi:uncharacterized protein LOC144439201 [Glandiceps talaboti]